MVTPKSEVLLSSTRSIFGKPLHSSGVWRVETQPKTVATTL